MTKQEYVAALTQRLKPYPQSFRQDIINAFEEHFQAGLEAGQSEEQIMASLGSIDEVMQTIDEYEREHTISSDSHTKAMFTQLKESIAASLRNIEIAIDFGEPSDESEEEYDNIITLEDASETSVSIRADEVSCDVLYAVGDSLSYQLRTFTSRFQSASSEPQIQVEEMDNDIRIIVSRQALGQGQSARLQLTIPSELRALTIETSSGDIKGEGGRMKELLLRSRSGDISLYDASAKTVQLHSASGDITADAIDADTIETRNASGDQSLQNIQGALQVICASGDIELEDCNGSLANISIRSGDIEANDIDYSICQMESASGDIEIKGTFDELTVESKSGSIALQLEDCPQQVSVCTTSGDIEVACDDDDYTAVLSTVSGDIEAPDFDEDGPHEQICGDGNAHFELRTTSGDIDLHD